MPGRGLGPPGRTEAAEAQGGGAQAPGLPANTRVPRALKISGNFGGTSSGGPRARTKAACADWEEARPRVGGLFHPREGSRMSSGGEGTLPTTMEHPRGTAASPEPRPRFPRHPAMTHPWKAGLEARCVTPGHVPQATRRESTTLPQ
ncbi:hypothetical protein VULLAG_LOCUS215 [Vulpes lagopus]